VGVYPLKSPTSFHIPKPPLPLEQQPEHIRKARQKMETFMKKQVVKEQEKQVQQVLP